MELIKKVKVNLCNIRCQQSNLISIVIKENRTAHKIVLNTTNVRITFSLFKLKDALFLVLGMLKSRYVPT